MQDEKLHVRSSGASNESNHVVDAEALDALPVDLQDDVPRADACFLRRRVGDGGHHDDLAVLHGYLGADALKAATESFQFRAENLRVQIGGVIVVQSLQHPPNSAAAQLGSGEIFSVIVLFQEVGVDFE